MIGFLNAYHFEKKAESYQLDYGPMFIGFLKEAFPGHPIMEYKVALGQFPANINEPDAWIISGSPKSCYEQDDWIKQLGGFVQRCHHAQKKLIGVCFGHQIIAHYLGGKTERSSKGWGVGVREFRILKSKPWMLPELKTCKLLFSHQDQVMELPNIADLLATDDFCPNQMYSIAEHIFCLQGHPEFTPQFAKGRLDARLQIIGRPTYDTAIASLDEPTDAGTVGEWIRRFVQGF